MSLISIPESWQLCLANISSSSSICSSSKGAGEYEGPSSVSVDLKTEKNEGFK